MKEWTPTEEKLLKEKYPSLTAIEIVKLLGRTKHSVKSKIDKMISKGQLNKKDERESKMYSNSVSESRGRNKTKELNTIKESFKINNDIKIKAKISTRQAEIIEGKIIQKTDSMIVVKTDNYTSSFKYIDFYTKNCVAI